MNVGVGDSIGVEVKVGRGVSLGVSETSGVDVKVGVADKSGVTVKVGVADRSTVAVTSGVGDTSGVFVATSVGEASGVKVGATPTTVRLAAVDGRSISTPSPLETRTLHSMAACPACNPLTVNVNTVPLEVALLPLLPAIAAMKLPFTGPLIAVTASAPKRLAMAMLPASNRLGS